jgi:hypothetical protein
MFATFVLVRSRVGRTCQLFTTAAWPLLLSGIRLEIRALAAQSWASGYFRPKRTRRPMAEWNAGEYNRYSSLQAVLAEEQLSRLTLDGTDCVVVRRRQRRI